MTALTTTHGPVSSQYGVSQMLFSYSFRPWTHQTFTQRWPLTLWE